MKSCQQQQQRQPPPRPQEPSLQLVISSWGRALGWGGGSGPNSGEMQGSGDISPQMPISVRSSLCHEACLPWRFGDRHRLRPHNGPTSPASQASATGQMQLTADADTIVCTGFLAFVEMSSSALFLPSCCTIRLVDRFVDPVSRTRTDPEYRRMRRGASFLLAIQYLL